MTTTKTAKKRVWKRSRWGKHSKEINKYWGLWSEIFSKFGVPRSEQSEWRRDLRIQLLGSDRNQMTFSHSDFDLVLGAMQELLNQESLVVYPQKVLEMYAEGEKRRTIHLIEKLEVPEAYICAITKNKYLTVEWRDLSACEVMQLFYTVKARKNAMERAGKAFYDNSKIKTSEEFETSSDNEDIEDYF